MNISNKNTGKSLIIDKLRQKKKITELKDKSRKISVKEKEETPKTVFEIYGILSKNLTY